MKKLTADTAFKQIHADIMKVVRAAPRAVGIIAVNHFEENFEKGGFVDSALEKWKPRKNNTDAGRGVLIGKGSGRLMRSIRVIKADTRSVIVGTDVPYARAHNEGETVNPKITPAMRKFAWAMLKKTKDEKWIGLALTSKSRLTIKLPKRQFIGRSNALMEKIGQWYIESFKKTLK